MSPSAATVPVLLVPGWSDAGRTMQHCREFLIASGWPSSHVHYVDFRDRHGSNIEHADEIAHAVAALRGSTGTRQLDIVAHSMGGLAVRYYLRQYAGAGVRSVIFVATPHSGTYSAYLAWGAGAPEMRPGSAFLRALNAAPLPAHVRACSIRTPLDTHVLPGRSAWLAATECHTVRMPIHPRMMRHPPTLRLIRDLLLQNNTLRDE